MVTKKVAMSFVKYFGLFCLMIVLFWIICLYEYATGAEDLGEIGKLTKFIPIIGLTGLIILLPDLLKK